MKSNLFNYLIATFILTAFLSVANAQTPGNMTGGTGTTGNTIPLNQASQKTQILYAPTDFTVLPINGNITKIYFKNSAAAATATYTNFQVRLMQTIDVAFPSTSYYTTGFTVVLAAPTYTLTGNATAGGWFEIALTTPYLYDNTKSLVVEIQYDARPTGGISTSTTASTGRNTRCSGTSLTATTGTTNTTQNNFGMDVVSAAACVTPPTPGTATKLPTSIVCPGTSINLGLTGNSNGSGQTYQWQHAIAAAGPYINIGTAGSSPSLNIVASQDSFYRCEVTCSGNFTYSTPVQVLVNPGMSGTYTINSNLPGSATNFQSYTAAVNALNCGVLGPVTFNVDPASGPYTEQITIPQLTGASATNRITFNGNGTTIQFSPVTGNRHVIKLDGADYITLNNLRVVGLDATYDYGIHLTNEANFDSIINCKIDLSANTSTTAANSACIAASGSNTSPTTAGNSANNLVISGCKTIGGYYGIVLTGTSAAAARCFQNQIINDTLIDFYSIGIQIANNDSIIVKGNDISRANIATVGTFEGIEVAGGVKRAFISHNRIHDTHNAASTQTGTAYGIYLSSNDAPVDSVVIVYNNLIYNFNSSAGILYGLSNTGSDGARYYHNTVVFDNQSATAANAYAFYQTTAASNIQLKNNTLYVTRSGAGNRRCVHFNTATTTFTSDYNNLYMGSTGGTVNEVGYANTTAYATLSAWQTGVTQDVNSVSIDPLFVSAANANYQPSTFTVDDKGTNVGVSDDIYGISRSITTPDIGAIEFHIPVCTAPPIAGNTLTDNAVTCKGQLFQLSFDNTTTTGAGQTYQWQQSTTQAGTYTDIAGLTNAIAGLSQTNTHWYRVAITCSGLTSYTTPVQVTTNPATLPTALTIDTTIAVSASNYHSLASLAIELNCKGISGPTTITYAYRNATAKDSVSFIKIPGADAVNTITIMGKGNTIVSGTAPVASFANTSYVTWDSLNIVLDATTGIAMHMTNQSQFITIRNSVINAGMTSTASTNTAIAVSGLNNNATTVGNNGQNITIENNTIIGGYYGITLIGNAGYANNTGHIIRNNNVRDFYLYGIYVLHGDTILIEKNDVSRPTRTSLSTLYGIYQGQSRFVKIHSNSIHNTGVDDNNAYPIYLTNNINSAGYESEIINNAIYDIQTDGIFYGIYGLTTNMNGFKIYHNTIAYNTPSTSTSAVRGLYISIAPANVDFKNNIISLTGAGTGVKTGIYITTTSATFTSNRNNIHVAATSGTGANNIGYWGAVNATLANWQTASSQDANSVSTNPAFNSASNLTPLSAATDNIGIPVGVLLDILGNTRSTTTPDIGAYEFTGVPGDLSIESAKMYRSSICNSVNDTLKFTLKNVFGSTVNFATDPLTINWNVSGPVASSGTIFVTTGTLSEGNTLTVYTTDANRNLPGDYTHSAYIGMNGVNFSAINDTLKGLTSNVKPIVSVTPKTATVTAPAQTVVIKATTTLFPTTGAFFSEIAHYKVATGAPVAGWPAYLLADDYVELTGAPNSDLAGYTMEEWSGTTLQHSVTFPTGTFFSPNGTMVLATGQLGSSVAVPASFYYHTGNTSTHSSTGTSGYILKNTSGVIIDAVVYGAYSFPAAAGVSAADWTGSTPNVSSSGNTLNATDNNTGSCWVNSGVVPQTPNAINAGVEFLVPADWTYSGSPFASASTQITAGPYTVPGVYAYVATYTNVCGTFTDTSYITAAATVPVKLVTFTATESNGDVVLNWTTASENNSSHFEVERSVNGKTFEKVNNVKAKGNSSNTINYRDLNQNAFEHAGVNTLYYRLKMVDLDNTFEYSTVAIVSVSDAKHSSLAVSPNPYTDKAYVKVHTNRATQATIQVTDITGRIVLTQTEWIAEGSSTLELQQAETLKTGIYFVTIEMAGIKQQAKVIKQ